MIHSQLSLFCGDDKKIKLEYSILEKMKLHNAVYFLEEFTEEHIHIILNRVHGDKMYLEQTHDNTLEAVHAVTRFYNVGEVRPLWKVTKTKMVELTGFVSDQWAMTIDTINDNLVKYACMVIGYRIFYASKMNYVPAATMNAVYRMIKEDTKFDLCTCLQK